MTPHTIERLRTLLEKATKGPWEVSNAPVSRQVCVQTVDPRGSWICGQIVNGDGMAESEGMANAEIITEAVNALPSLLDHIEGLEKALEQAIDLAKIVGTDKYSSVVVAECATEYMVCLPAAANAELDQYLRERTATTENREE